MTQPNPLPFSPNVSFTIDIIIWVSNTTYYNLSTSVYCTSSYMFRPVYIAIFRFLCDDVFYIQYNYICCALCKTPTHVEAWRWPCKLAETCSLKYNKHYLKDRNKLCWTIYRYSYIIIVTTPHRYCLNHFAGSRNCIIKGVASSRVPLCLYQS
jgi:hypothetical protein